MTFNKNSEWFLKWTDNQKFLDERQQKTERISAYFEDSALTPKSMLDIGCGLAYTFLDATKDLQLETQLKFDFIYSGKSCGFHYPLNTCLDLIKRHSRADSVIVMDLRKDSDQKTDDFIIDKVLIDGEKHDTCVIRVNN
tara:strand:- start:1007 stop:1423 length:417 start_codon:yes stop_codon:yes gene_type:complete